MAFVGLWEVDLGKPGEAKLRKAVLAYSFPPEFRMLKKKYYTISDIAEMLNIDRQLVWFWVVNGRRGIKLPATKDKKGWSRIRHEDYIDFVPAFERAKAKDKRSC